ncbi:MAG: hypothetical protein ABSC51_10415 [Gaiellaceae bacterium]|jgi:hypothetical protein
MAAPDFAAYEEEVARALGVRGQLRRRISAELRARMLAYAVEERAQGASDAEAEKRALARLGPTERITEEFRERVPAARVALAAQVALAGFVVSALGLVVIGWRVAGVRAHRADGEVMTAIDGGWRTTVGFFHHYPGLSLWLPPGFMTLKILIAALLMITALVATEVGIGLARRRWRAAAALVYFAGVLLVASVAAQIAFGLEWARFGLGHGALLAVVLAAEVVVALTVLALLSRVLRLALPEQARLPGRPWLSVYLAVALLAAIGAVYGFRAQRMCALAGVCSYLDYYQTYPTSVNLSEGPVQAQGDVALRGRTLAVALTVNRHQPPADDFSGPASGPLGISVLEASWPAALQGPCGRAGPDNTSYFDPLAPDRRNSCDLGDPASHPGVRWRQLARIAEEKPGPLALAFLGDGRLALAYYRAGALSVATAPAWKPVRVLTGRIEAVRIAPLGERDLVLALIARRGSSRQLELVRLENGHSARVPVAKVFGRKLALVASGRQLALLYRLESKRLVFELRTPRLGLLERRDLGRWTQGALGKLPGGRIGIATLKPLMRPESPSTSTQWEKWLTILVARRGRLSIGVSERLGRKNSIGCRSLEGVVQTGGMVRVVGNCGGPSPPRAPVIYDFAGSAVSGVVADWFRYASLGAITVGGSGAPSWRMFQVDLWQPPEQQVAGVQTEN